MRRSGAWVVWAVFACSESARVQTMPACPPDCPASTDVRHLGRQPANNPIPAENARSGDGDWRKGTSAKEGELEAYVTQEVAQAGDRIGVRVDVAAATRLDVAVYRLGHYGGAGARKVASLGAVDVSPQPSCTLDAQLGLVECPWAESISFDVGADWVSGLYLVRVTRPDRTFRFAPFVVRDHRAAELLFVSGTQTSQAYNRWGGVSLYADATHRVPNGRAHVVSHDRPFREADGAGLMLRWEVHLARFLEAQGYDVTYGADGEFERYDDALVGIGMVVYGGHSEYWTSSQRTQLDQALEQGRASLAYFGANGGYWRVRLEPGADGRAMRRIACFKEDPTLDPQPGSTVRFRDEPGAQPENALFGNWYASYQLGGVPLVVGDANDWVLEGTGLANGDVLPGLLGYEFDALGDNGLTPEGTSVVMDSPTLTTTGLAMASQFVERVQANGRVVLSAGSIYFPLALSGDPELHDDRVARIVQNAVEKGLSHRRAARVLATGSGRPSASFVDGAWASSVSSFAAPSLQGPTGLALLPSGELVVAETRLNRIVIMSADGVNVSRIAGDGQPGARDGGGDVARFRQPTGVVVMPDGSVLVADVLNHAIRRLFRDGASWRVETYAGLLGASGSVDGDAASARFTRPAGVAVDAAGDAYVADQGSNKVRRIEASTRQVTTIAGAAESGDADAARGEDARMLEPSAIAVGGDALFVVDGGNARLRRVERSGNHAVSTIAGSNAGFADGDGSRAKLRAQLGIAATPTGELVLCDTGNHRVRLVIPGLDARSTLVRTLAGTGRAGNSFGSGDVSDTILPAGSAVAADGTIFVTDAHRGLVLRIQR